MVTLIEFVSLDGVIEDPDGSGGTPFGGWAFRYGAESVAGDKFALGELLDRGLLLVGRVTWELFAKIWPNRTDDFSRKMNAIPKLVASRTLDQVDAWSNSALLSGDLVDAVRAENRDVIVAGSASIADTLMAHHLVDQYRLLVFPTVLGQGRRLFAKQEISLKLASAERVGQAVRMTYNREGGRR